LFYFSFISDVRVALQEDHYHALSNEPNMNSVGCS